MPDDDGHERLAAWIRDQVADADEVRVHGLDRIELGHSAEMLTLTVTTVTAEAERALDVVVRLRPPEPGLLEPYDLQRQFEILRALDGTDVRAPRALWIEPSGDVLGRPFFVMERMEGEVWEREPIPAEVEAEPGRLRRMCESMVDQFAAVHLVDLRATGLDALGDGRHYVGSELDHWESEMRRVQLGPLPALERLLEELRRQQPEPCPRVTLVHGDPKPGNVAFVGDTASAVFDWELASIGDPLADVGYLEIMWALPVGVTSRPSSLGVEEFVARWEKRTGITAAHREWYRAMQAFKLGALQLVGSMLFDAGHWDDPRAFEMAMAIELIVPMGLRDLGIDEKLEMGPIYPRAEDVRFRDARR
jgi:aminoglycoside phosphotransferase (APT) family kinase protein